MRSNRSLVAFVAAVSLLAACNKSAEKPAETAAAPAAAPAAASAPAAAPAGGSTMMASNTIGVPECDNYVTKYMECVGSKVPEAARAQYKASFDAAIAAWRQAAATPEGKAGLAAACTQASAAAAQAMTSFGCTF